MGGGGQMCSLEHISDNVYQMYTVITVVMVSPPKAFVDLLRVFIHIEWYTI